MQYRKVPKTGDELSVLGFGCMRLPVTGEGRIDEERAKALLRYSIDRGVNYVDTAWPYHGGESEPFVGRALQDGYRQKVKLATKLPTWLVESRSDMDRFLDAQLEKLQTDHIDYYLMHTLYKNVWNNLKAQDVAEFMDTAKRDGRIINAGFSFHGMTQDFNPIVDEYDWDFCQIQLNYMDTDYQAGVSGLEYAASKGLAVIVMEPLRGGSLAKSEQPDAINAIWARADKKRTPAEWALRWVWDRPEVTLLLSGMNEQAQVDENMKIADEATPNSLTEKELGLLNEAGRKYIELMAVNCTGCGYCMPCPANVMIPFCFEELNNLRAFGGGNGVKMRYASRMSGIIGDGKEAFASLCVRCGECLDKCPQHIQIPDMLEEVVAEMEGDGFRDRVALAAKLFTKKA